MSPATHPRAGSDSGVALYSSVADSAHSSEQLINDNTALVQRIAHHLLARLPASVQLDDLLQAGMLGLLEASRRFDSGQGASFATFAERRIRGAMLDEIRKGDWVPRSVHRKAREVTAAVQAAEHALGREAKEHEIAEQMGISLSDYQATLNDMQGQKLLSLDELDSSNETGNGVGRELGSDFLVSPDLGPEDSVQRQQAIASLAAAIDALPERERLVMSLYYDEGLNLKEIGQVLEISESRVSQILSQTLARLRARLA